MEPTQIFTLNYQGNILELDLSQGAKILKLVLKDPKDPSISHTIITGSPSLPLTANGSFLMFPWVNRIESSEVPLGNETIKITPKLFDGNGVALHGLFADSEREIIESGSNFVILKVKTPEKEEISNPFLKKLPKFTESFILLDGSLSVMTDFSFEADGESLGFSYGYHPYIQLDDLDISNVSIRTNMTHAIQVDEKLLPLKDDHGKYQLRDIGDVVKEKENGIGELKLDNGFVRVSGEEESYFNLVFNDKGLEIGINDSIRLLESKEMQFDEVIKGKEKIGLRYFQVYTPADRKRIAVEPQSAGVDAFFCGREELRSVKGGENGKYGVFNIVLKGKEL